MIAELGLEKQLKGVQDHPSFDRASLRDDYAQKFSEKRQRKGMTLRSRAQHDEAEQLFRRDDGRDGPRRRAA